jgi:hypothetical protein
MANFGLMLQGEIMAKRAGEALAAPLPVSSRNVWAVLKALLETILAP